MNRLLVAEGDYSEYTTLKLRDCTPEPEAVKFLGFDPEWIFYHTDAPLFFQIRPLPKHFFLEIVGILVFGCNHAYLLYVISGNI